MEKKSASDEDDAEDNDNYENSHKNTLSSSIKNKKIIKINKSSVVPMTVDKTSAWNNDDVEEINNNNKFSSTYSSSGSIKKKNI